MAGEAVVEQAVEAAAPECLVVVGHVLPPAGRHHSVVRQRLRGLPEAPRVLLVAALDQVPALDPVRALDQAPAHDQAAGHR